MTDLSRVSQFDCMTDYERGEYDVWASRALAGPLQRAVA